MSKRAVAAILGLGYAFQETKLYFVMPSTILITGLRKLAVIRCLKCDIGQTRQTYLTMMNFATF
jgi:hypothetical protein